MANPQQKTKQLIDKYLAGKATPEEINQLERAYQQAAARMEQPDETPEEIDRIGLESWITLMSRIEQQPVRSIKLWPRIAVAASVLIALSTGGYFLLHKQQPAQQVTVLKNDVAPGHNRATLTLANGKKIILTKGLNGQLAVLGQTQVNASGGAVIYEPGAAMNAATPVAYNTLATARGEQSPYPLVLSDRTKVWLNAASSVTFPTNFTGTDRVVRITGEAAFEVAHNAAHPFKVEVRGQVVEDLGTEFNINAYADEPVVRTSLLQGKVRVSAGNAWVDLLPSQQAVLRPGNKLTITKNADVDAVFGWKNGRTQFDNEDITSIMRMLSRWYDIKVSYAGNLPKGGLPPRYPAQKIFRKC